MSQRNQAQESKKSSFALSKALAAIWTGVFGFSGISLAAFNSSPALLFDLILVAFIIGAVLSVLVIALAWRGPGRNGWGTVTELPPSQPSRK